MKTCKLLLLIGVVSVCAPAAFAQTARGLKYVPQAVKGAKAVPYVVSPKLSPALRTNLAVPVVRPNVATKVAPAVERAVATKVTVQGQLVDEFRAQGQRDVLRQEKELAQQEKAWAELVAEEQHRTEAEEVTDANAATIATKAESNVPLKGNVITNDYVEQLLNFYNKLDPWGTGTIQ